MFLVVQIVQQQTGLSGAVLCKKKTKNVDHFNLFFILG